MASRRAAVLVATVGLVLLVASCTSGSAASPPATAATGSAATTPTPSVPPTTAAPTTTSTFDLAQSAACPPGCRYPSDYDAVTVLASSADLVAIVHVTGTTATVARVLQGNPHDLVYPPGGTGSTLLLGAWRPAPGTYLVFFSYSRGGSCPSAVFAYDPATEVATLVASNDGQHNQILLPGRTLPVPPSIGLDAVRQRMYPTGAVVYPSDAVEWYCPGP